MISIRFSAYCLDLGPCMCTCQEATFISGMFLIPGECGMLYWELRKNIRQSRPKRHSLLCPKMTRWRRSWKHWDNQNLFLRYPMPMRICLLYALQTVLLGQGALLVASCAFPVMYATSPANILSGMCSAHAMCSGEICSFQ